MNEYNSVRMIEGVLFDMDGVLFDTEKQVLACMHTVAKEMDIELTEEFTNSLLGLNETKVEKAFHRHFGTGFDYRNFNSQTRQIMFEQQHREGMPKKPGLDETLKALKEREYRMAIASSSPTDVIRCYIQSAGVEGYFDAVVGGDIVTHSKPRPEIYLRAAREIGIPSYKCVAVEDSPNGLNSAHSAGCYTVMIPDVLPPTEQTKAWACMVLENLTQLIPMMDNLNGETGGR